MPGSFHDHPRKRVVRERWNTPILEWLYNRWGRQYFYFGLPGPTISDIKLWRAMIRRVVAFELVSEKAGNPRKNIEELRRNLTLLNIPHAVYCGPMEEVVLWKEDHDGQELRLTEFVTLFNLDFCNAITGLIPTVGGGRRCLRFEAIREIVTMQRRLFRSTRINKFVMLITAYDSFHVRQIQRFVSNPALLPELRAFVNQIIRAYPLPACGMGRNTRLLKAFVFDFLRACFEGQNIQSFFLPPVSFLGSTARSPMIHFTVICIMEDEEAAQVVDEQGPSDFLRMKIVNASDHDIRVADGGYGEDVTVDDPVGLLSGFENI